MVAPTKSREVWAAVVFFLIYVPKSVQDGNQNNKDTVSVPKKETDRKDDITEAKFVGSRSELNNEESQSVPKTEDWHPNWHHMPFPDQPLQLVKPGKDHKRLELVEHNFKKIEGTVATIAVVGKFHTGKSFLLNQLMGKSSGFGVGPSVRPQTMGIWMWGKPLEMSLDSGEKVSVVFLDTEGFAANNVSENYDAKIFAVATLLSSYLVYNSVKIIDQSDIDYLELLARRTQLFALRSQMSKAKWTDDFNHDLLSFPPLLWVVQDFVQTLENQETPKAWLRRLMKTRARETEDYDISLLGVFKSVDCHTMFLPATKRHLLIDLSKAKEDDLTSEYKEERDELIQKLRSGLKPKEKNERAISGPELASLLEILVSAANDGSLAAIPSRWDSFIKRLETGALEDCTKFYEAEIQALYDRHDNGPVHPQDLENWHNLVFKKSLQLLEQLLFGLGDIVAEGSKQLTTAILQKYNRTRDTNEKKVRLKCTELQHRVELDYEAELGEIQLPSKTSVFQQKLNGILQEKVDNFVKQIANFTTEDLKNTHVAKVQASLSNIADGLLLQNKMALEKVLEKGIKLAEEIFNANTINKEHKPRTPKHLEDVVSMATQDALKVFTDTCALAAEEKNFNVFKGMLMHNLVEEVSRLQKDNENYLHQEVQKKVQKLNLQYDERTSSRHLTLPVNDTALNERLQQEFIKVSQAYEEGLEEFTGYGCYKYGYTELQNGIENIKAKRRQENVEAFAREVEVPLKTAKKLILLSADKYDTVFSLTQFVRSVCMLNLNEGKPKNWPDELKASIIDHFVETDPSVQKLMVARIGLWSTILGFFQWVLWLFGF